MTNAPAPDLTRPRADSAAPTPPPGARRFSWQVHVFEVTRRVRKGAAGGPVGRRRVRVLAPYPEAALAGAGVARDETCRPVPPRPWERWGVWRRVSREEISDFYETIGNALATGAGMTQALNMATRVTRSAAMRGVIGALYDQVVHGEDLHTAMRAFPWVFSPMQHAIVEAAAATGLDKAGGLLVTLAGRLQRDGRVWRKFIGALTYPLVLLVMTMIGAIVLEVWALPPMVELFKTLGGELPWITRKFYEVAQVLRTQAYLVFPAVGAVIATFLVLVPRWVRTPFVQRLSVHLWLIGPVIRWLALGRALGTFILLKQSGARVRDQFSLAAAAAGNCVVAGFFEACYERIALGESVEEAFTSERHWLGVDGVRIAGKMEVGMAGGDLSGLINRTIEELTDRAETRLNAIPNAVRWPLLILCCAIIGTVALAIVLPYPNLIADVAHQNAMAGK